MSRRSTGRCSGCTTKVVQLGRSLGSRLTIFALLAVLAVIVAPGAAIAATGQVKLALTPVDQPGSYFDLTMRPGETRSIKVDIANVGEAPLVARTYAADVYTIINGGFGGRLRSAPQTDTTQWLDYPSVVLELAVGSETRRSFSVAVPADAESGEYITSLVVENDEPILGDGTVALNQVVRQAVAVVITVPGIRSPALEIGAASHSVLAGNSVVSVQVENTGNVRLKPIIEFTLLDAVGAQVSKASMQMDTFYAHTKTTVEIQLAALLLPGSYSVSLELDDAAQAAGANDPSIVLVVDAPFEPGKDQGVVPGLTEVTQGGARDAGIPLAVWAIVVVASVLLATLVACLVILLRRDRTTSY